MFTTFNWTGERVSIRNFARNALREKNYLRDTEVDGSIILEAFSSS
jgi:hypothetical protein